MKVKHVKMVTPYFARDNVIPAFQKLLKNAALERHVLIVVSVPHEERWSAAYLIEKAMEL